MKIISEATETIAEIGLKEINRLKIALAEKEEAHEQRMEVHIKGYKAAMNEKDEQIASYEAMKEGVQVRIGDLEEQIATLTAERDRQNDFIDKVEMAYPEFYEHHKEALRGGEGKTP